MRGVLHKGCYWDSEIVIAMDSDNITELVIAMDSANITEIGLECPEEDDNSWEQLENISLWVGGYGTIVLATMGVCANILAICVFCNKTFKSNFNNLLIALAVFDLLFLVVCKSL